MCIILYSCLQCSSHLVLIIFSFVVSHTTRFVCCFHHCCSTAAIEIPPRYHSAFALDDAAVRRGTGGSFGYPGSLYKVVDRSDSQMYALRRFDNVRTSPTVLKSALGKWFDVRHPSIVSLHSISQERGALFFTHAFHPAAQTLKQRFLDQRGPLLNEVMRRD